MNVRRSRFLIPVLVLMLSAMALAACGESDGPDLPDTTAASVIAYLDEVNYQESWELWPGLGEKVEGGEPHGMLLTTYLNPVALQAFNDKAGAMPDGAIIVKENYTPAGELAANTVMYKQVGLQPRPQRLVLAQGARRRHGRQARHGRRLPKLPRRGPRQRLRLDRAAEIAREFRDDRCGNAASPVAQRAGAVEADPLEAVAIKHGYLLVHAP